MNVCKKRYNFRGGLLFSRLSVANGLGAHILEQVFPGDLDHRRKEFRRRAIKARVGEADIFGGTEVCLGGDRKFTKPL